MTPWGIRKKLKSFLGARGGAGGADDEITVKIVLPNGTEHTVKAEPRYTLTMASQTLETPIESHCPDGACGECVVEVLDGTGLAPPTEVEARLLAEKQKSKPSPRLACHARVVGSGARVRATRVWTLDQTRGT